MNLLADEGIDKPIVDLLRINGFDVIYILETNQGAEDEFILAMANALKEKELNALRLRIGFSFKECSPWSNSYKT